MDGATLTARYLEEVRHRGLRASELLGDLPASEFLNAFYAGRYLSRPLFIGASELARLYADVESVRACVVSLPDRLFGTWYDAARDMPRSATVFNLGYDLNEAARYPYVAQLTGAPPRDRPPLAGEDEVGQAAATELFMPQRRVRS